MKQWVINGAQGKRVLIEQDANAGSVRLTVQDANQNGATQSIELEADAISEFNDGWEEATDF